MINTILSCANISKSYHNYEGERLDVLDKISIDIEQNKITMLVGASGAGKSTLLHILSGLDNPDSGTVIIDGRNLFELRDEKLSEFRNRNIGFIFQFHHLLPEFSAIENISIPQMIAGKSLKQANIRSAELLELVALNDRKNHKPAELSGGEQQRVAVARALANDPKIIFADEPTGNLDSVNGENLHNLFVRLRDELKKTFLIVTHNPALVKLGDYIYEIKDGKIL